MGKHRGAPLLPPYFTTADLRRTFEPHGRIVSLVALTGPVGTQPLQM